MYHFSSLLFFLLWFEVFLCSFPPLPWSIYPSFFSFFLSFFSFSFFLLWIYVFLRSSPPRSDRSIFHVSVIFLFLPISCMGVGHVTGGLSISRSLGTVQCLWERGEKVAFSVVQLAVTHATVPRRSGMFYFPRCLGLELMEQNRIKPVEAVR